MRLEAAEVAVEAYGETGEPFDYRVSDLVTDLLVIVREREGQPVVDRILRSVDRDLAVEPESRDDFYQLAAMWEREGATTMAAKLYEKADDCDA